MHQVFQCLYNPETRNSRMFTCHGFLDRVIDDSCKQDRKFYQPRGPDMDMHDAHKKFGLPYAMQFNDNGMITHSALMLGWDGREPILADKWVFDPICIRHMWESREVWPHQRVHCYPAMPSLEVRCPPFVLHKRDDHISLHMEDGRLIETYRCGVMQKVFDCLHDENIRNDTRYDCHAFVDWVLECKPRTIADHYSPRERIMDMHDAQKEFGLPYAIQCSRNGVIRHSAFVLGWDGNDPILADKWSTEPLGIRYMWQSRLRWPHTHVHCYPARLNKPS